MGSYYMNVIDKGRELQVLMRFSIATAMIDPGYYSALQDFLSLRVEKENENVVLRKIVQE